MTTAVRHLSIRCGSAPYLGRSGWMTIEEAHDLAMLISEEAYRDDIEQWGSSRVHDVQIMNHEENTIAMTVAYQG